MTPEPSPPDLEDVATTDTTLGSTAEATDSTLPAAAVLAGALVWVRACEMLDAVMAVPLVSCRRSAPR